MLKDGGCGSETVIATGSSVVSSVCSEGNGGEEEDVGGVCGVQCVADGEVMVPFRVG